MGTRSDALETDLGALRASQERPGATKKQARAGPETLPDRLGTVFENVSRTVKRARGMIFRGFRFAARKLRCAPMCVSYQFFSVLYWF